MYYGYEPPSDTGPDPFPEDNFPITLQKGYFDLNREQAGPSQFGQIPRPVTSDVDFYGWVYAGLILSFSLLIILPAFRKINLITYFVRVVVAMLVLFFIMLCNFGQDWEVAYIERTQVAYRPFVHQEIKASIGVHIGLRSVNITLKGIPEDIEMETGHGVKEHIDYNERFSWANEGFTQGRAGFGFYATPINRDFRDHQRRGTPYPILNVAEYFTADGEGLRWGRHYRQAGYYTYILMWAAFPVWLLTLVLFNQVIRYGGYFSILTACCLFIANITFSQIRNANQLEIQFPDAALVFRWGWCFWLNLFTGLLTFAIGVAVLIIDLLAPDMLSEFFNVDIFNDYEEFYLDPNEVDAHFSRRNGQPDGLYQNNGDYSKAAAQDRGYRKKSVLIYAGRSRKNKSRESVMPPPPPPAGPWPREVADNL